MTETVIRDATPAGDAGRVAAIYNHYIAHTVITFEIDAVSEAEIGRRMAVVLEKGFPYLVAEQDGMVVGYAYAAQFKDRAAYVHSAEATVYLAPDVTRRRLGTALYTALFARLRDKGIHVVIGGISLPNAASVGLHESLGFRPVGAFREVGFKFDRWIDVGYWELQLDAPLAGHAAD